MSDLFLKTIIVNNGIRYSETINLNNNPELLKKLTNNIVRPKHLESIMRKYALKNGLTIYDGSYDYLCKDCVNMLTCPKVTDFQKKDISKYGFIKDGIELVMIDKAASKAYKEALEEYKTDMEYYESLGDCEVMQKLANTGVKVLCISVYNCSNFSPEKSKTIQFDDIYVRVRNRRKKEEPTPIRNKFLDLDAENEKSKDLNINNDIIRIKNLRSKK